jgi:diketogulonate reductase-like aldo/keto reductase
MPLLALEISQNQRGEIYRAVRWAVKLGYTHFDCSASNTMHSEIKQALADILSEDKINRKDLFIGADLKINGKASVSDIENSLKSELDDLGLDYLDLAYVPLEAVSEDQSFLKIWAFLEQAYQNGLCKALGISGFDKNVLAGLIEKVRILPAVIKTSGQSASLLQETADICQKNQIVSMSILPDSLKGDLELENLAKRLNVTPLQALTAQRLHMGLGVMTTSLKQEYLHEMIAALSIGLDQKDMDQTGV